MNSIKNISARHHDARRRYGAPTGRNDRFNFYGFGAEDD
jgi:hypothetical protein